ncbi:hypothetical protein INT44_001964 [Umbelopsis vinacea]|uniref:Uncharacterized protein n=1 Tax=Umbelopsis vinacea TaxID=44442 RepID=A0A8H7Q2D7_9FUNG|nr:hypothetical protein INT44_001964 [Umbelopsis vinacea]
MVVPIIMMVAITMVAIVDMSVSTTQAMTEDRLQAAVMVAAAAAATVAAAVNAPALMVSVPLPKKLIFCKHKSQFSILRKFVVKSGPGNQMGIGHGNDKPLLLI